jgi:hypothetical protein
MPEPFQGDVVATTHGRLLQFSGTGFDATRVFDPVDVNNGDGYVILFAGFPFGNSIQIGTATSPDGVDRTEYTFNPVITHATALLPMGSLSVTPKPPLLLGRSKGPGSVSDRTKPNGAAKPIAVIGPPSYRVARARMPAEIFGNLWNFLFPGCKAVRWISRVCERVETFFNPGAPPLPGRSKGPAAALEQGRMAPPTNQSRQSRGPPRRAVLAVETEGALGVTDVEHANDLGYRS